MKFYRALLIAISISFACSSHARSMESNAAAVKAVRELSPKIEKGNSGRILFRQTTIRTKGKNEIFELVARFEVLETLTGSDGSIYAYVLDVALERGGIPGRPNPEGFDRLMKVLFPPVKMVMDNHFRPLKVIDWWRIEAAQKSALQRLNPKEKGAVALVLGLKLLAATGEDLLLSILRPIGSGQRPDWVEKDGTFEYSIEQKNGNGIVEGKRILTPVAVDSRTIKSVTTSNFNTEKLVRALKQTSLGKLAGNLSKNKASGRHMYDGMTMTSTGEMAHDVRNGWLVKDKQVLTVELPEYPAAKRTEIFEVELTRLN